MSSLFSAVRGGLRGIGSRVLEFITEAKDPVHQLADHWKALLQEHENLLSADTTDIDDSSLLLRTEIKAHVEAIISLILEETQDTSPDSPAGPCIEFLLEEDVIRQLCAMGNADRPPGMLSLCLYAVNKILVPNVHTLLPNMGIHDAVHHLISVCIQLHERALAERAEAFRSAAASSSAARPARSLAGSSAVSAANARQRTQGMVVQLVSTVWWAIRENPSLLTCFFDTGGAGSRSRQRELLLLRAIIPHMKDPRVTGDKARDALVCAVALRNPAVTAYIMKHTKLCAEIAHGLADKFNCLNMESNAPAAELLGSRQMATFLVMLRFANAVAVTGCDSYPRVLAPGAPVSPSMASPASSPAPPSASTVEGAASPTPASPLPASTPTVSSLGDHLLVHIAAKFFQNTLRPCLMHTSEVRARAATVYVHGMVAELGSASVNSPILELLLRFLLGDAPRDTQPPPTSVLSKLHFSPAVRECMVGRLDALNHDLALATAEVFGELAALNHRLVLEHLVLQHLVPAAGTLLAEAGTLAVVPSEEDPEAGDVGGEEEEEAGDAGGVEEVAGAGSGDGEAGDAAATTEGQGRGLVAADCTGADALLLAQLGAAERLDGDETYACYMLDAQQQVVACAVAYETWGDSWWAENVASAGDLPTDVKPSCPFVETLLRKLTSSLAQPTPMNLAVTGILSRLAQSGHPLLHAYLFPQSALKGEAPAVEWVSLVTALKSVWSSAEKRAAKVPEFEAAAATARSKVSAELEDGLAAATAGSYMSPRPQDRIMYTFSKERRTLIEAYVLLEEFVKEMAAVLDAKGLVVQRLAVDAEYLQQATRYPEPEDELGEPEEPAAGAGSMPADDTDALFMLGDDDDNDGGKPSGAGADAGDLPPGTDEALLAQVMR